MQITYLSLGSNLGDRARHLEQAIALLDSPELRVRRVSSVWETEPQGVAGQPWFLNAAVEAETILFPRKLLHRIQRVEQRLGRRRGVSNGPRTIDIDILLYGRHIMNTAELTVPHPRMEGRRFVLEPMAELAPDLRHPVLGAAMRELLTEVSGQAARKMPIHLGAGKKEGS